MTNQTQTTPTKSGKSETTIHKAPDFTNEIKAHAFRDQLSEFIQVLSKNPDTLAIKRIKKKLGTYQIISIEDGNTTRWITSPPEIVHTETENSLWERLSHLVKTGGEWKDKHRSVTNLNVHTATTLPFKVPVTGEVQHGILSENIPAFKLAIEGLHMLVNHQIDNQDVRLGLFEKPFGVTNNNRIKAWITENEHNHTWAAKHSLKTHTLDKIIEQAEFVTS